MQRRLFLQRTLIAGAVVTTAGAGSLALYPTKRIYRPSGPLRTLDEAQFAILAAVANRVVTVSAADPVEIAHVADAALARAVPEAQEDFKRALWALENALVNAILQRRFRPFTRLSADAQDRAFLAWRDGADGQLRGAYRAVKNLCTTSFYRKSNGWAAAGYPGPPEYLLRRPSAPLPGGGNP